MSMMMEKMTSLLYFYDRDVSIKELPDSYEIKGEWLGSTTYPIRNLLGEKKVKIFFNTFNIRECKFHKFFLSDFIDILDALVYSKRTYGLNIRNITKILNWFKENTIEKDITPIDYKAIEREMRFKILKHQEPIFERYEYFRANLHYRGMLLDAEPGTGKTFSALALCTGLHATKVVILCPLPTVEKVWVKSLSDKSENVFKKVQSYYTFKDNKPYENQKYIICHYEAVDKLMELTNTLKGAYVIIDESHNLNDLKSKRTDLAIEFVNNIKSPNVFLLSGTPLKSGYREMTALLRFIDPYFTKQVEKKFLDFFKSPNEFIGNLLKKKYGLYSVKVTKASIGLPELENLDIIVKLPDELAKKYTLEHIRQELREYINTRLTELKNNMTKYEKEFESLILKIKSTSKVKEKDIEDYTKDVYYIRDIKPGDLYQHATLLKKVNKYEEYLASLLQGEDKRRFIEVKSIIKYPYLKVQGEALGNIVTKARIECHADMVKYINFDNIFNSTGKKTIVFSNYIKVCEAVRSVLGKKYKTCNVYGEYAKNLNSEVSTFTKKDDYNPMIASYKSLATGVPLTVANIVVCIDMPFRMYVYEQAIARVWRLGQDQKVIVYKTRLDTGEQPNINSRNIDIIQFFKEEIERITGYKYSLSLDSTISTEDFYDLNFKNTIFKNQYNKYSCLDKWGGI